MFILPHAWRRQADSREPFKRSSWNRKCLVCNYLILCFSNKTLEAAVPLVLCSLFWAWWCLVHGQIRSVAQSCPTLCDPMNRSMPGLPVYHQFPEFTETHIHRVSDAIQPSHPPSSPSSLAPNPSQHQSLFQWVNSSHEVAKVLEFQL